MKRLLLIDGNSIMNRAFYGIMGNKMLSTKDGKYTNAVYGFLAIMFKILEDIEPDYMAVSFDLKAPTARHKMYDKEKLFRISRLIYARGFDESVPVHSIKQLKQQASTVTNSFLVNN